MTRLFCLNFWFYSLGSLGVVTSMLRLIGDSLANLLSWNIRGGLTTFAVGFPVFNQSNVCKGCFVFTKRGGISLADGVKDAFLGLFSSRLSRQCRNCFTAANTRV